MSRIRAIKERISNNHAYQKIKGFHFYAFGLLRRLYDWVMSWATTPYGLLALFLLSFSEASFFPIPPDVLLIALVISRPRKAFYFAFICLLGSVLGGILGYYIGYTFFSLIGEKIIAALHYQEAFEAVGIMYKNNAFFAILAAALTPIPYKVFTIAAGFWHINLWELITASIFGRGVRFFAIALLFYFFGPKMKEFIDRYFNLLSILAFVLLIGGFILLKFIF